ncbi:sulfite oxidase-like oxidoreductase [Cryobacterium melibiosiphilum]|uniref:Sulfite oxidase-like oxidoreductase n=1 Tax=Cryobacterium melibiosiphilum TaxID=995039 RepID=A0A3A5MQJ0_9MICO|nr:molybdopterin-dependent oxidoreductase [Cryobacterium melibiosiphilum]RJT88656.1 sulfite oxidase-like oxidoreductase [Cryobacterium melibiosiphilum]RJT89418.1 sulfite oxidase-like oxidoreductase [Cryobacterium melibiosiphilum]
MKLIPSKLLSRRRQDSPLLPPGQSVTDDLPVRSSGPIPSIRRQDWEFLIRTERHRDHRWDWAEFQALPQEDVTVDIHGGTGWSKLATRWRGVSLDVLLDGVTTRTEFAMAHSYGGYTTNLSLADLRGGQAWIAHQVDDEDLTPEHGGPARLIVPHLYFWKSAKWVHGLELMRRDEPGFWELNGYHMRGDPWQEERYW